MNYQEEAWRGWRCCAIATALLIHLNVVEALTTDGWLVGFHVVMAVSWSIGTVLALRESNAIKRGDK